MKSNLINLRIFLIFQFVVNCNLAFSQWFPVNQDTTLYNYSLYFQNADTGFVVGEYFSGSVEFGVISRTLNGGLTWDTITTAWTPLTVHFPSTNIGYAGGHNGAVYKTSDMGTTWNLIGYSNGPADYSNIHFFDNDTGITMHWGGQIYKTINGGSSWNLSNNIGGNSPYPGVGSIQFLNDSIGIIAAGQYGTYARTTDQGSNWQSGQIDSSMNVITIHMQNQNFGYAVGYWGKYSRTFDGGQTWTTPDSISRFHLNDIAFFTDSIGYIVGGYGGFNPSPYYKGIILKTIDGGNNWAVEDSTLDDWLLEIQAVNSSIGYACGYNGRILKTTNGNSVGMHEDFINYKIADIFPSPSNGIFNVRFDYTPTNYKIEIYNPFGVLIENVRADQYNRLDLSNHADGIYLYRISSNFAPLQSGKIIMNR